VDQPPYAFAQYPDVRLAVLAIALAIAASFVALSIFQHARESRRWRHVGWLALAGIVSAFGIWSSHLVAILGHGLERSLVFDSGLMIASIGCVLTFTCAGFALASYGKQWQPPVGGAVNGIGLGGMHYLGMYAVVVPGGLAWDLPLVALSLTLGAGFSAAGLAAMQWLKARRGFWWAVGLLTAAFFALHYTAMRAAHDVSDPLAIAAPDGSYHWILSAIVVGTALIVLLLGTAAMLIDRQATQDNVKIMQQLVDTTIEGIVVVRDGRITGANQRMFELYGLAPEALLGRAVEPDLLEWPIAVSSAGESRLRLLNGDRIPVKVVHRRLASSEEVYAIHDLRERQAAEAELQRRNLELAEREEELQSRNLLLDTALSHMSQGLCMYDKDERVVVCNQHYSTVYGLPPDAVKPGMKRREVIEKRIANGVWSGSPEAYLIQRTQPVTMAGQHVQEMSNGRTVAMVHVPMPGGGWVCTHEDITERRQVQAKVEHLARHDVLTDLPNRVLLREELQGALQRLRAGEGLAVHCLDLDRFKEVNDALGQTIGDELLQAFAGRLRRLTGETVLVARTGGDEFVIVQNPARSPTDATELAAAVIDAMVEPFELGERFQVVVGISIGIAMAPGDGIDAEQLLKNANLAMTRAKEEERGKYRFFEKDMDERMRARHELECSLRAALANGELELDYQPLLNLRRNEISCFEALLRWRTPDGRVIPPSDFVALAEETGLILPIGEWVLRAALAEAAKWPKQIRVAVNLSPVQFNSRNLAQIVMGALAAAGVEARRLELEITESVLLQDREATLTTLHQLRDLGVRIALDDFGTGFSSLNYLRSFPFDKLKIDRCFIEGLAEDNEESLAIVRAVAQLGASLGIATTAEGIETPELLEVAYQEGFTEAQGYWIGKPKSAQTIIEEYSLHRRTSKSRRMNMSRDVSHINGKKANGHGPAAEESPKKVRRVRRARMV
jgi:diguanylate cyclase (GGDEF)-like protein